MNELNAFKTSDDRLKTRMKTLHDYLTYMQQLHNDPTYGDRFIQDICHSKNDCFETVVPEIFDKGVYISVKPIKNATKDADVFNGFVHLSNLASAHEHFKLNDGEDFTQLENLKTKKSRSDAFGKMSRTRKFLHILNPWNWRKGGNTKRRRRRTRRRRSRKV